MAQKIQTLFVDDLDGSEAEGTVRFGLDGTEYEIDLIFHLAAVLSTRGEFAPMVAHKVNVEGTLAMLEFAQREGESHGRPVVFLYPSSIAAYGIPTLEAKAKAGPVTEDQFNTPTTMYGCNKLYGEHLGTYYAGYYKQLSDMPLAGKVDFRERNGSYSTKLTVSSKSDVVKTTADTNPYIK